MHGIYDLKEKLCKELEEYGTKNELTAGSLDVVDKLAHTVKNLDKIIEAYEEEDYSSRSYDDGMNRAYANRGSYMGGSYRNDGSYARRRDSMGRYSRNGDMVEQLRSLMNDAPDDRTRQEIQRLVTKMEQM